MYTRHHQQQQYMPPPQPPHSLPSAAELASAAAASLGASTSLGAGLGNGGSDAGGGNSARREQQPRANNITGASGAGGGRRQSRRSASPPSLQQHLVAGLGDLVLVSTASSCHSLDGLCEVGSTAQHSTACSGLDADPAAAGAAGHIGDLDATSESLPSRLMLMRGGSSAAIATDGGTATPPGRLSQDEPAPGPGQGFLLGSPGEASPAGAAAAADLADSSLVRAVSAAVPEASVALPVRPGSDGLPAAAAAAEVYVGLGLRPSDLVASSALYSNFLNIHEEEEEELEDVDEVGEGVSAVGCLAGCA